jgi:hypothetical protein
MSDAALQIVVGIIIAAMSSFITVRLSKHQFRSERWWERKVAAYERVIEAFHDFKRFSSEHLEAAQNDNEVPKDRETELRQRASRATDEIKRASDIGSFLLSKEALAILEKYHKTSETLAECDSWWEYLDKEWSIANEHMKEFIAEAHRDLKQ